MRKFTRGKERGAYRGGRGRRSGCGRGSWPPGNDNAMSVRLGELRGSAHVNPLAAGKLGSDVVTLICQLYSESNVHGRRRTNNKVSAGTKLVTVMKGKL